jgi:protein phosphatase 1 regulatory subunit 7
MFRVFSGVLLLKPWKKIENLDSLVNLEELWLGKNKITKLEVIIPSSSVFLLLTHTSMLQNLSQLKRLKILSLQSNRITVIEGLEELTNLEELYLSHNGVKRLEGLDGNVRLDFASRRQLIKLI